MRARATVALVTIVLGIAFVVFALGLMMVYSWSSLNVYAVGVIGALLIVVGLLLLVTELMEAWLSRGQSVLVDGLQAG